MSLTGLADILAQEPSLATARAQAGVRPAERSAETVISVADGMRPVLISQLLAGLRSAPASDAQQPVLLVVTATGREAEELEQQLPAWAPQAQVASLPAWETLPHERLSPRSDTVGQRLDVMRRLAHPEQGALDVVVAPVRAVLQPVVEGMGDLQPVILERGAEQSFDDTVRALAAAAYSRTDMVSRRGEFAVRGGILDVFPPTADHPVRVEFFGDEIEELRWFAVADQRTLRSGEHPQRIVAPPCRELLITPAVQSRAARLKDRLPGAEAILERIAGGISTLR